MDEQEHGAWYALLSPRDQATVDHALNYALNYAHAGVPGHSAHLLIAKLATELDKATVGVTAAVDHSLLTPATPSAFDPTRPPDVSKKPKGFV